MALSLLFSKLWVAVWPPKDGVFCVLLKFCLPTAVVHNICHIGKKRLGLRLASTSGGEAGIPSRRKGFSQYLLLMAPTRLNSPPQLPPATATHILYLYVARDFAFSHVRQQPSQAKKCVERGQRDMRHNYQRQLHNRLYRL